MVKKKVLGNTIKSLPFRHEHLIILRNNIKKMWTYMTPAPRRHMCPCLIMHEYFVPWTQKICRIAFIILHAWKLPSGISSLFWCLPFQHPISLCWPNESNQTESNQSKLIMYSSFQIIFFNYQVHIYYTMYSHHPIAFCDSKFVTKNNILTCMYNKIVISSHAWLNRNWFTS